MVKYAENELVSISDFTKRISSLVKGVKNNEIEKIGVLRNNNLEVVVLSTKEYSKLKKIEEDAKSSSWEYWNDTEIDNFGKIAIGLSNHDYDDEDYSTW